MRVIMATSTHLKFYFAFSLELLQVNLQIQKKIQDAFTVTTRKSCVNASHTARRVASARFADGGKLPHPLLDGGIPSSLGWGGYLTQSWTGGIPSSLGWGVPKSTP